MASVRRLIAIVAADVAGYSHLMGADEEGTHERLQGHLRELVNPKIAEHRGRVVKNTGDGFLAEFQSVLDAVRCAVEMQRGMPERNAATPPDKRIEFRVGINLGDVIAEANDIYGDGVNVAARLEALAEPGGICISRVVRDQIRDKLPYPFADRGEQTVKNIARPVRVFALNPQAIAAMPTTDTAPKPNAPIAGPHRRSRVAPVAGAGAAVLTIAAIAWWVWQAPRTTSMPPAAVAVAATTSIAQPPVAPRLSIVVLPFAHLSDDPDQQYFADGITEDLMTDLSRIPGMFVISRNTAFTYRNKPVVTKQIGRELGVRYVLEGSVRRSGSRVRVTAQLIDTETDAHLWAEQFDHDLGDLFALQDEVTSRIAIALNLKILRGEAARPTDNPNALDYVLRGRSILSGPVSKENTNEALTLFEKALAIDPHAVDAAAWAAITLTVRVTDELSGSPDVDLKRAEELTDQALAAAPDSALAHYANAQVLRAQSRCNEAILEYQKVIALDRNRAPAYAHVGWCKFLTGSVDEAIPYFERAIRLSPYGSGVSAWYARIGLIQLLQSQTDQAIASLEKARTENARLPFVHIFLAAAYGLRGQSERARTELAEARKLGSTQSSLAKIEKSTWLQNPKIHALVETTYLAGLRKAGMPEE
jgi:TolB-like protein/class 3 adenylate cyclase/Tfp pilus assembly protein PilF